MNDHGASLAFQALAAGDDSKLDELCVWLSEHDGIAGRYLGSDLRDATQAGAAGAADGGLDELVAGLRGRPDSVLAAFFPESDAPEVFELPGAVIGSASALAAYAPSQQALEAWPEDGAALAILTSHPSQGRLGAMRTAAWLQTVLGAIGLAAYAHLQIISPLASCPAFGTAVYLSTPTGEPHPVDRVALAAPTPPSGGELAQLTSSAGSFELLNDATALQPADLAQKRLTLAARWLQLAASAISTADALVALGVALETITGDSAKGAVVDRITKRSAIFLADGAPTDERGDVFYDELKRAKKLYDLRSRAAHGQYDEWTAGQSEGDAGREEFHRFVLDVALGFREHARARSMGDLTDFQNWWKRAELEGYFT